MTLRPRTAAAGGRPQGGLEDREADSHKPEGRSAGFALAAAAFTLVDTS